MAEPERLQKLIASAGICSRRDAEKIITEGRVTVNGRKAALGEKADIDSDIVLVDGKPVIQNKKIYVMLNKPSGYVTTMSDEFGRRIVTELVNDVGTRIYPVGRLDYDSEGLLIMTNDGALANVLMHPSHGVRKTYRVEVTGINIAEAAKGLSGPLKDDKDTFKPAEDVMVMAHKADRATIELTISEGKNREVRRMCALCGLKVIKLTRVKLGEIRLGSLPSGKWRYLTEEEIHSLDVYRA